GCPVSQPRRHKHADQSRHKPVYRDCLRHGIQFNRSTFCSCCARADCHKDRSVQICKEARGAAVAFSAMHWAAIRLWLSPPLGATSGWRAETGNAKSVVITAMLLTRLSEASPPFELHRAQISDRR